MIIIIDIYNRSESPVAADGFALTAGDLAEAVSLLGIIRCGYLHLLAEAGAVFGNAISSEFKICGQEHRHAAMLLQISEDLLGLSGINPPVHHTADMAAQDLALQILRLAKSSSPLQILLAYGGSLADYRFPL